MIEKKIGRSYKIRVEGKDSAIAVRYDNANDLCAAVATGSEGRSCRIYGKPYIY